MSERFTLKQAAALYGSSPRAMLKAIHGGHLPATLVETPIGPAWMVAKSDVEAWRSQGVGRKASRKATP
jgi:hypothetical protein